MTPHHTDAHITVNGEQVPLRLTLAALAEIEEALGVETLTDLALRLANPSATQLLKILGILARAAGAPAPELVREGSVNLREVLGAVTLLFRELMTGEAPGKPIPPGQDGAAG